MATGCYDENVLLAYCERTLDTARSREVSRHVDSCSDCRIVVSELVRQATQTELDPALHRVATKPLVRGSSLGRYLVLEQVGSGGMGVVYAAYDADLDRRVAVKLLRHAGDDKLRARLVQEARAMAKLSHPNVATVYGVETLDDRIFVTMEFIVGETARAWLLKEHPVKAIIDVFLQAGRGLEAAHQAGIVHRDFKPDNVMVRPNGRVSVLDFGLARTGGASAEGETDGAGPRDPKRGPALTQTGAVMGTLRYMPPEQRFGRTLDARADQYAFCVSLHEALYGAAPSDPPLRSPSLSGALTRAIVRGRSEKADDRFPDMHALLSELERAVAPTRRWAWGAAAAALLGLGATLSLRAGPGPCAGVQAEVEQVWGAPQKSAIRLAFGEAGLPPDEVVAALDGYATSLGEGRRKACEATRVAGTQSEELLDLRMLCLASRKASLSAAATQLAVGGAALLRAPVVLSGMPRIDDCADARWLLEVVPPPADPQTRARLERTRAELARAQAERDLGRVDAAAALLERVVADAKAIDYPPLLCESLVLETEVMRSTGHTAGAEAEAWLAVEAALASRDQRLQAQAWLSLAETVGIVMRRFGEAERLFSIARSALVPLSRREAIEARWLRGSAHFLEVKGDTLHAVPRYLEAIAAYEQLPGAPRGAVAWLWRRLGETYLSAEQPAEAEAALRKSIALGEADATGSSQLDRALVSLADVLREQRRFDEARGLLERALPLARSGGTSTSPVVALYTLGHLERDAGNLSAAARWYQQYLERVEALPRPNPYLGDALALVGEVQLAQGDAAGAERVLRRAVTAFDEFGLRDDVETLFARTALARALIANGHRAEAVAILEHAVKVLEASPAGAAETAKNRFRTAQALWALGGDRPKALALAKTAREASGPATRAEIDAWLENHR